MNTTDLKKQFGDEYPAAIIIEGIRLPLRSERRFAHSYHSDEHERGAEISRFMDGSASITASELRQEWPGWDAHLRSDFCQSSSWLNKQSDFPEMLRYIMEHGGPEHWSGIASSVAACLPLEEAFDVLVRLRGRSYAEKAHS